jgi:hypothetical protein
VAWVSPRCSSGAGRARTPGGRCGPSPGRRC